MSAATSWWPHYRMNHAQAAFCSIVAAALGALRVSSAFVSASVMPLQGTVAMAERSWPVGTERGFKSMPPLSGPEDMRPHQRWLPVASAAAACLISKAALCRSVRFRSKSTRCAASVIGRAASSGDVKAVQISSARNSAYKQLVKLESRLGRTKAGRFVAEGDTFLRMRPRTIFIRQSRWNADGEGMILSTARAGAEAGSVNEDVSPLEWGGGLPFDDGRAGAKFGVAVLANDLFDKISTQEQSQGVLCVFALPSLDSRSGSRPVTGSSVMVLDRIEDPNNLGVIMRTMEAFGSKTLIMTKGTVDVFNPKVVRCSMGAVVRGSIEVMQVESASELRSLLRGFRIFATSLAGGRSCVSSSDLSRCVTGRDAFVLGNEARGVSPEVLAVADDIVRIPMVPGVDSLNVSVAAGIVLHAALPAAGKMPS
ncbi:unnamed protein product [Polarella glacialis]|uniref:tRNA/rRNA methyltransferase SpoU type domain-containing protein n=2 Tax=Polarella glacialis TaxID=89957 RepID=A0A813L978_POLGL|nr:unnamed protein product [Polarella glacialis]CAE8720577.1 unnamed protein product [Polarella glacialis]